MEKNENPKEETKAKIANSRKGMKNIIFVGETGSGKSTTCNSIVGAEIFGTSDSPLPCTKRIQKCPTQNLEWMIIDTPGLMDVEIPEEQINAILQELTVSIVSFQGKDSSVYVDALVMVTKCTPRPANLKSNLERIMELYGKISLKSLIILMIYVPSNPNSPPISEENLFEYFSQMKEINHILMEGKNEKQFSKDWYVVWDNFKPWPNQLNKLAEKIKKLEPYTHQKFIDAQEEIKARIEKNIQEAVRQKTEEIKKQYAQDINKQNELIHKLKDDYEKIKNDKHKRREEMFEHQKSIMTMMMNMKEEERKAREAQSQEFNKFFANVVAQMKEAQQESEEKREKLMIELMKSKEAAIEKQNQMFSEFIKTANEARANEKQAMADQLEFLEEKYSKQMEMMQQMHEKDKMAEKEKYRLQLELLEAKKTKKEEELPQKEKKYVNNDSDSDSDDGGCVLI